MSSVTRIFAKTNKVWRGLWQNRLIKLWRFIVKQGKSQNRFAFILPLIVSILYNSFVLHSTQKCLLFPKIKRFTFVSCFLLILSIKHNSFRYRKTLKNMLCRGKGEGKVGQWMGHENYNVNQKYSRNYDVCVYLCIFSLKS